MDTPGFWSVGTPYNEEVVVEVRWIWECIPSPSVKSRMTYIPEFIRAVRKKLKANATSMENVPKKSSAAENCY